MVHPLPRPVPAPAPAPQGHGADLAMALLATVCQGCDIAGKVLGVVGFDAKGQECARRAHFKFGMKVRVHSLASVPQGTLDRFGAAQIPTCAALLPQCDIVLLHAPKGTPFGAMLLDQMREDAILINAGPHDLVDQMALAQSLMFDTLGGAAMEVLPDDPPLDPMLAQCDGLVTQPAPLPARSGLRLICTTSDARLGTPHRDRVA